MPLNLYFKDPEWIKNLEREVIKKYGEKTLAPLPAKDIESSGIKELNERIKKSKDAKRDVAPRKKCIVCNKESFSGYIEDEFYLTKYEVCKKCFIVHIEGREEKWPEKKKRYAAYLQDDVQ